MSSILTNTSAMIALQTLKGVNSGLEKTQSEISTGKTVASARDNSAIWAISKVMESDVTGFKAISDSLALGESTVSVAQQAAETVTDLLGKMKEKIVAATGSNVDRTKLNADVTALKEQIASVVSAAQFNGLNLVDGSTASTDILASLDRDSTGAVTPSYITVNAQDLSTGGYSAKAAFQTSAGTASGNGDTAVLSLDATTGTGDLVIDVAAGFAAGDKLSITIGDKTASYTIQAQDVAGANDTAEIAAAALKASIESLNISGLTIDYDPQSNAGQLDFTNTGSVDLAVSAQFTNAGSGGLGALATVDVSTLANAQTALASIESLTDTAISAAAAFGSDAGQIDIQADFVSKLTDSLKAGIGSMVDADMEEASARLQALQVQQQLGIQALSIANQAPQNILSLFR